MAFVRSSRFRHVFAPECKKENCYEGFRPTNCAFDGNFIAANQKFLAFCVEVGGSGAFSVIRVDMAGRLDANLGKVSAHKEYVLDLKWNPFNDNMLASCSEDGSIRLWDIGERGITTNIDSSGCILALEYHQRRCTQLCWHPIADNVLMSVSQDLKICVWNLDDGVAAIEIELEHIVYNAEWSMKGDKIVTSSRDKNFRIYDGRTGYLVMKGKGHEGSKPQRVIFTHNDTMLFSCGFSRMSERQFGLWKIESDKIVEGTIEELDASNGVLVPYYDPDTQMVYLAAKGDSVIRYYEIIVEEPYYHYLTTHQGKDVQRSICHIPKRSVDVNTNEIMKFYKMVSSSKANFIKPVAFQVPRKSDLFQHDLYPNAISVDPAQEAYEWFEGNNVEPKRVDMTQFFKGKQKPGAVIGGGLKKGGLKGLKAKKDAKEAAKKETPVEKPSEPKAAPAKTPSPEPSVTKVASSTKRSPSPSSASATADSGLVKKLQDEISSLKDNEKKMQKDIKTLTDKLKDHDKLTGDIKLLCDAVKKNDERLNTLEALVQEESDNEA